MAVSLCEQQDENAGKEQEGRLEMSLPMGVPRGQHV